MHPQDGGVRWRTHEEAGGDHDLVVARLRIDVFDAVDALDDGFERLGDELHRVLGLEAIGLDEDVDHWHGDLRLLLARQREQRHEADREGGEQEQGRERRLDEGARQPPGNAEAHGVTTTSPSPRPERISTAGVPLASKR